MERGRSVTRDRVCVVTYGRHGVSQNKQNVTGINKAFTSSRDLLLFLLSCPLPSLASSLFSTFLLLWSEGTRWETTSSKKKKKRRPSVARPLSKGVIIIREREFGFFKLDFLIGTELIRSSIKSVFPVDHFIRSIAFLFLYLLSVYFFGKVKMKRFAYLFNARFSSFFLPFFFFSWEFPTSKTHRVK